MSAALRRILASACMLYPDGEEEPLLAPPTGGPGIPGTLGTALTGLARDMTEVICTGLGRRGTVCPLGRCMTRGYEAVGDPSCLLEGGVCVMTDVGEGSVGFRES